MAKYLRLFETSADYQQFIGGDEFLLPNVSLITDTKSLFYHPLAQEEPELPYLTITALEDDFQINLKKNRNTVYYSLNGTEWMEFNGSSPVISSGEKIYFKGNTPQGYASGMFYTEKRFNLSGNCMSLIFGDEAEGKTDLTGYNSCFSTLFNECPNIIKVSPNFLPATTLANHCYEEMFSGCTSLVTAPELPATTLSVNCYNSMFAGCTSLVNAPELPATELVYSCYGSMFQDCTSLVTAPELPATRLAEYCYSRMFNGCTSLNYIKMLGTDIAAENCIYNWVENVSPTGTFVMSPDATWDPENNRGRSGIPDDWNVLYKDIDLNNYLTIEVLEDGLTVSLIDNNCRYSLDGIVWNKLASGEQTPTFNSGEKIYFKAELTPETAKGIGTFTVSKRFNLSGNAMSMIFGDEAEGKTDMMGRSYCFSSMFNSCTGLVSVSKNFLPATTLTDDCYSGMFKGCTSLVNAPELPATKATRYCYESMFEGCTSLVNAPELPADLPNSMATVENAPNGRYSYSNMFKGCTSLVNAPELPATELAIGCYKGMFEGCTSLETAPELPATVLPGECYISMFKGCTSLNYIKALFNQLDINTIMYCLNEWVNNVSLTGTFVKSKDATWDVTGYRPGLIIPEGWTVETA